MNVLYPREAVSRYLDSQLQVIAKYNWVEFQSNILRYVCPILP